MVVSKAAMPWCAPRASAGPLVAAALAAAIDAAAIGPALAAEPRAGRAPGPRPRPFDFAADKPGGPPAGFAFQKAGEGKPGRWVVEASRDKGRGHVLVQRELEPNKKRFVMAVVDAPELADATVKVRCKILSGSKDQACGVVLRYQGQGDHYLARADAQDANLRLYVVKGGVRSRLAEFPTRIAAGVWHELAVAVRGDRLVVFWDGIAAMDIHDKTLPGPGRAGLWTKSDALVEFDDLEVGPYVEFWVRPAAGKKARRR
jgi:hypothetical protein